MGKQQGSSPSHFAGGKPESSLPDKLAKGSQPARPGLDVAVSSQSWAGGWAGRLLCESLCIAVNTTWLFSEATSLLLPSKPHSFKQPTESPFAKSAFPTPSPYLKEIFSNENLKRENKSLGQLPVNFYLYSSLAMPSVDWEHQLHRGGEGRRGERIIKDADPRPCPGSIEPKSAA